MAMTHPTNNCDYLLIIHDAISTQSWSGEAVVHVSIVNWCYEKPSILLLDFEPVETISSSLQTVTDVSQSNCIKVNRNFSFKGIQPSGKNFIIDHETSRKWIHEDRKNEEVLKIFSDASTLAKAPNGEPERWIVDFNDMSVEKASEYKLPFNHIKAFVKPERDENRRESTRV